MSQTSRRSLFVYVLTLVLIHAACAFAATRRVPADFSTIQQALNASQTGDTVRVSRGVYREAIRFPAADVKLFSEYAFSSDSADLLGTIIDASDSATSDTGACVSFFQHNTTASEVCGFVLRGGSGSRMFPDWTKQGGGVLAFESSATIRSNIFTQNIAYFSAISMTTSAPIITHNQFYDNGSPETDALIALTDQTAPSHHTIFEWNDIGQNQGMCATTALYGVTGSFSFNHFHDFDYASNYILQIYNVYVCDIEVRGNIFERITSGQSGWPLVEVDETVQLIQDNVWRNSTTGSNFALSLSRERFVDRQEIIRNLFQDMYEPAERSQASPGIFIQNANVDVLDNVFENCSGGAQGMVFATGICGPESYLRIERNRFVGNRDHTSGAGAAAINLFRIPDPCNPDVPVMVNNWFEDNGPVSVGQDRQLSPWNVPNNYWGDSTGPYHPIENPNGRGDTVEAGLHVTPWLTHPPDLASPRERRESPVANTWQLEPVYPNPFNASVTFRLSASRTETIKITIHDITGRQVKEFWQGVVPTSVPVELRWNGTGEHGSLASGVYFIRAMAQGGTSRTQTRKAVLIR